MGILPEPWVSLTTHDLRAVWQGGMFEFERKLLWDTIDQLGGAKGLGIMFVALLTVYMALIFMLPRYVRSGN